MSKLKYENYNCFTWCNKKFLSLCGFLVVPNDSWSIYKYDWSSDQIPSESVKYPDYYVTYDPEYTGFHDYGIGVYPDWPSTFYYNGWLDVNMRESPYIVYDYSTQEYTIIAIFIFICLVFSLILCFIVFIFSFRSYDNIGEKSSIYECGFEPFGEAQSIEFSVQYFIVGILYLIFDLELSYLFPWALCLGTFNLFQVFIMWVFIFILILGFIYEWRKGALEWS